MRELGVTVEEFAAISGLTAAQIEALELANADLSLWPAGGMGKAPTPSSKSSRGAQIER